MEIFKSKKVTETIKGVYILYRYTPYSKAYTTHRMPVTNFCGGDVVKAGTALLDLERRIIRGHCDPQVKVRFSPLTWSVSCKEGEKTVLVNLKYFYPNMKMVLDEAITIYIEGSMKMERRKPSASVPKPDAKKKLTTSVSKPDVQRKPRYNTSAPKPDVVASAGRRKGVGPVIEVSKGHSRTRQTLSKQGTITSSLQSSSRSSNENIRSGIVTAEDTEDAALSEPVPVLTLRSEEDDDA